MEGSCDVTPNQPFYNNAAANLFLLLQRAIEVFGITEPRIPQRPPVKDDQKGGWYG